ncbi:hypothetical protein [Amycolatopsis pithecellobii]|uniref:SRPBCC family protein n=1 Tax=Amycolatopsis pithecellobii TaxID=664692 RepID=A0A6N7Z0U8_9PSEU|nr:hypothetical protein [Amycolatopsis pithecellobii]MTD53421.1 hypothetical protein [Amycolatopsis pithecellobii]
MNELLDVFAGRYDFALTERLTIEASTVDTYATMGRLRGGDLRSPALPWARGLPLGLRPDEDGPAFEEILLGGRWVLLGERPGHEIVLGAAGRFWTPLPRWHDITPGGFACYNRPRSGTIAVALAVRASGAGSVLTFETRVRVPDPVSRRWAELYWHRNRSAAKLVARRLLDAINGETTGGHGPAHR